MAFVETDHGFRLYYEDTGGPGPTVLFLHGARFEQVEAAGHSTYFEQPDIFNREVGAFLKAHRP